MSSEAAPISATRFAEALKDLPISSLHSKVLEIRNQIAHLDYSNEQLREFADDADCVDAIQENEVVIARMTERIALIKTEVENRGANWTEFQSATEVEKKTEVPLVNGTGELEANGTANSAEGSRSNPWTDGTFQMGRITNGEIVVDEANGATQPAGQQGGRLSDEELRRQLAEHMAEGDDDEGMHL